MSSEGKSFSSEMLAHNHKEIIRQSIQDSKEVTEPENPQAVRTRRNVETEKKIQRIGQ